MPDVASLVLGHSAIEDGISEGEEKVLCHMTPSAGHAQETLQIVRVVGWIEAARLLPDCVGLS